MKVKKLYCFGLLTILVAICSAPRLSIASQNFKVIKRLSQLNKAPLMSTRSEDGDVIDCVHVSQQPAFDHPSLKDHDIQMSPNNYPELAFAENKLSNNRPITQLWQWNGSCPKGTIPMRRTKDEEVSRALSINSLGNRPNGNLQTISQSNYQIVAAAVGGEEYYGAKAIMNLWEPQVETPNDFSASQLLIFGGDLYSNFDTIAAGWHVFPALYGDNRTRFFIFWSAINNSESRGCFNLQCSGFVQTNNEIVLGGTISSLSTFDGFQAEISLVIWNDPTQGVWWLGYENTTIGYWPNSLFASLKNNATAIEWGGQVLDSEFDGSQTTSTQMGSGHFPSEGFKKSSYMRNLQVFDNSLTLRSLNNPIPLTSKQNCYDISLGKSEEWGDFIFYGGPGRNPNCP